MLLEGDEYITEVSGRAGALVDRLVIQTNKGRRFTFGGTGGEDYEYPPNPTGEEVFRFFGRAAGFVDAIGIETRPRT